jgi:50S ribosomal protein L16 3-hydroxylase
VISNEPLDLLGGLTPQKFLQEYWQKKPLLIRNAIAGFTTPISPDELAGLACEPEVESRIVLEKDGALPWHLQHGPFDDDDFAQLPESYWTLLVQECNKYVPELALLLDQFDFVPGWRIDDVMVSYAAPEGSVGPHVDQYDVFLLQGLGQRRWQINTQTVTHQNAKQAPDFLPGTDLRILREFEPEQEWLLEPGDMLYLPPGVAHHGVAVGECMTLSVGFRAPSHYDLFTAYADDRFATVADPFHIPRYQDPDLTLQENTGEITEQAVQRVVDIIQSYTRDPQTIKRWFGQFITEPKHELDTLVPETSYTPETLAQACRNLPVAYRMESVKFAFMTLPPDRTFLYVNGIEFELTADEQPIAPLICNERRIQSRSLLDLMSQSSTHHVITKLFNEGYLSFDAP